MNNPFTKKRDKLINRLQDQVERMLSVLQDKYEMYVIEYLEENLVIESGKIKNTAGNFTKIRNFNVVKERFYRKEVKPFLTKISQGFIRLLLANINYFKHFEKDFKDSVIRSKTEKKLLNQLGIERSGSKFKFKKGGWIEDMGKFDQPYREIKNRAIRATASNLSLSDLRKDLKRYIKGGKNLGVIEGHFMTSLNDAYSQFDALASDSFRSELDYICAIYQGGIIKTSRPFCIKRNNKVFTIDEIEDWKEENFQGKPNNYNPIRDRGGHNCRHFFDWIPDALAIQLRPDIEDYINKKRRQ